MEISVSERLNMFSLSQGMTINKLCSICGIAQSTVASSLKRKGGLSSDVIEKVIIAFPNLSSRWLLTGKGEMLKDNSSVIVGGNVIGDHSRQEIGDTVVNGSLNTESSLRMEIEKMKIEIEYLKKALKDKEEIINILKESRRGV